MKTKTTLLFAALLFSTPLFTRADTLTNNFWLNPAFEEGQDLDLPAGTPAGWKRGGSDPTICQISAASSVSPKHSLAVIDQNSDGYGEWYADYALTGLVREGRLVNLQWFELYSIDSGEMRVTAVFLSATGGTIGAQHWVARGQSKGWTGSIATSTLTRRTESVALPPGTRTFRLSLVSGGSLSTTGVLLIDDLSAALAPSVPVLQFGNFWPNPGFEQGENLDSPAQGKLAGWNRGGSDSSLAQITHDNYNSSTHGLAVVDNGASFGEWFSDFDLSDRAKPGDKLSLQWFELFNISAGGEMRLSAQFSKSDNTVAGLQHFIARGQSAGWAGDLPNSSFTKRTENVTIPAGAAKFRLSLVSGGPPETTGLMVLDDLSVAPPPRVPVVLEGSFWPNPGFEEGAQLDNAKAAQPSGWLRGGSDTSFDQISTANWASPAHSLAVTDTREDAYGEWYRFQDLAGLALPGQTLQAQWWWLYDTTGDMRLSFLFLGSDNSAVGQKNYIVKGQSAGWKGTIEASSLTRRVARILVPDGATRLQTTLASGGSAQVTGTIQHDDFSLRAALPNADTDGDGMTDAAEEIAGTDAEDEISVLRVSALARESDGVHITWLSVPGKRYVVEFADKLGAGAFTPLIGAENILAAEKTSTTSFIDKRTPRASTTYYRVRVLAN
jgi:hypothetical protein